ncbi:MAG: hypothetical protein PVH61_17095 [Candidatus Aminicenantes bacterium]|jgi:hypothetical protein
MYPDQEITALSNVYDALNGLNQAQVKRIIDWVTSKFELDKKPGLKAVEKVSTPSAVPTPVESAAPAVEPVKKRRGRPPAKAKVMREKQPPQPVESRTNVFMKFVTFEDLFFSSNAKTITAKILLASAYLQENKNIKEFGSSDINSLMKKIGQGVSNISASINVLLAKQPPLLIQTGKTGTSKQARRTYAVTEEGLRIARNYINE